MKKIILTIVGSILWCSLVIGQFTTVNYDATKAWFNEGQVLPAEKDMVFKGILPQGKAGISIFILSSNGKKLLYKANGLKQNSNEFSIPVNYKLRADANYDFRMAFFEVLPGSKQADLKKDLKATMATYIDVNISGSKSIKLLKNADRTVAEMNEIMEQSLSNYLSKIVDWQPAFSEVVRLKLEQLDNTKLEKGIGITDTTKTIEQIRLDTRTQLIKELQAQVEREIDKLLNIDLLFLSETQLINDYPTEKKETGLSINVGYAGVYLSGKFDDLTYGGTPYVGLAFPLGNSVMGSKFMGNSAITFGILIDDFENNKGERINGFLVKTPIYLGLDHRLFKFLRVNAGITLLEDGNSTQGNKILVRPFLGLSAKIDLNIGLGQ